MIHVTPCPVVDMSVVDRNIDRMQTYCNEHGLRLRPHIKTHKSIQIARKQMDRGAVGITCQKIGEAEVFADAGFDDILLSYPQVGDGRIPRLVELAKKVRLSVYVDGPEAFLTAQFVGSKANSRIGVWIDFDSGANRTGIESPSEAVKLADRMASDEWVSFEGLATYPLLPASAEFFAAFCNLYGQKVAFSGAGTPTAWQAHEVAGLTEVRQGSYVYNDRSILQDGAAALDDCAYHILTTVIARPSGRAILDAGSKSLTSDLAPTPAPGYGLIREYPDLTIVRLYEEHAVVPLPAGFEGLKVGERVRILPNHVCPSVNLHDSLETVQGGLVRVDARGRNR